MHGAISTPIFIIIVSAVAWVEDQRFPADFAPQLLYTLLYQRQRLDSYVNAPYSLQMTLLPGLTGFTNNADLRMNQAGFVRLFMAVMKRDFVTGLSIMV